MGLVCVFIRIDPVLVLIVFLLRGQPVIFALTIENWGDND